MKNLILILLLYTMINPSLLKANDSKSLLDTNQYFSGKLTENQIKSLSGDLLELTTYYLKKDDYDKAQEYYYKYISTIEKSDDVEFKIFEYLKTAKILKTELFFDFALEICFHAIELADSIDNIALLAKINNQIGNVYYDNMDYKQAFKHYKIAKEKYELLGNESKLIISYINLGEIMRFEKKYKKAIRLFKKSIELNKKYPDSLLLGITHNNLALVYIEIREYKLAYDNLVLSKKILVNIGEKEKIISINNGFAYYNFKMGNYKKAIELYYKTLNGNLTGKEQEFIIKRDAEKGLYEAFSKLKLYKEALNHYKIYNDLSNQIFEKSRQQRIYELQFQNKLKNKENEIELLQEKMKSEQSKKHLNRIIYFAVLGLLLLLIYTLFLQRRSLKQKSKLFEQKNKLQKLELENKEKNNKQLVVEKQQLEAQQEINRLAQKNLEEKLEHKKRELSLAAMHAINKNEILTKVKDSLDDLKVKRGKEAVPIIAQINREISSSFNIEDDWESFKLHFESVHQDFFRNLITKFPDLTTEELKLCAYLRINLNSKEISQILNITPVAVNKRRNRLRKKIQLDQVTDLVKFMIEI